ncbi:hypothetical protein BaRGS_00030576 [Batillaria attramentaria]|uniref:Uncharacterized protein n=1 Tax=Batillaria attramentaria TaxID=370345 RepID=A0ABD0JUA8_9CAEN
MRRGAAGGSGDASPCVCTYLLVGPSLANNRPPPNEKNPKTTHKDADGIQTHLRKGGHKQSGTVGARYGEVHRLAQAHTRSTAKETPQTT